MEGSMPRIARLIIPEKKTVYHVISRTALAGFPFGDVEKEGFIAMITNKLHTSLGNLSGKIGLILQGIDNDFIFK